MPLEQPMILTGPETWSCHNSLRSPLRVMKKTLALLFCVVTPILAQEGTPPKLGPVSARRALRRQALQRSRAIHGKTNARMHQPRSHPVAVVRGELAVVNPNLPEGLRLARLAKGYQIIVEKAGRMKFSSSYSHASPKPPRGIRSPSAAPPPPSARLPPKPKATAPNWNSSAVRPCPARATIAPPCAEPWARIAP